MNRKICLLMAVLLLGLSACGPLVGAGGTATTTVDTTTTTSGTATTTTTTTTTTECQSDDVEPEPQTVELAVGWYDGYVGSDRHGTVANQNTLVSDGLYAYTDIIHLTKAGTTIWFADTNKVASGNTESTKAYASSNAYVLSHWKNVNGVWSVDTAARNYHGGDATLQTTTAAGREYKYTSQTDDEYIRLCYRSDHYRSEKSTWNEKVYYLYDGSNEANTYAGVKWQYGYVANRYSNNNTGTELALASGGNYSYSDVICIPKAGTRVEFTDALAGFSGYNMYVLSHWKRQGNDWVGDSTKKAYTGAYSGVSGIPSALGISQIVEINCANESKDPYVKYAYITGEDNEYIRLSYKSTATATAAPSEGYPLVSITHTGELPTDRDQYLEASKKQTYYTCLQGLTINCIGDSYFAGQGLLKDTGGQVWPALLAGKYGMTFDNKGIGGSTISNKMTNAIAQSCGAVKPNPMVDRYTSMPQNNADIILFEGGRNDFNHGIPIGTNSDTGTDTVKGAMKYMIEKLHARYPNAVIICITAWKTGHTNHKQQWKGTTENIAGVTNYCDQYAAAMVEVAALYNYAYSINAADLSVINVPIATAAFRLTHCIKPGDASHMNYYGMQYAMPLFEAQIARIYAQAKGLQLVNQPRT